jgi:hypothetical protein
MWAERRDVVSTESGCVGQGYANESLHNGKGWNNITETFKIYCGTDWSSTDGVYDLEMRWAKDLFNCTDDCVAWNTLPNPLTPPCVGVSWMVNVSAPDFSECWLKSRMNGPGYTGQLLIDSAQRIDSVSHR